MLHLLLMLFTAAAHAEYRAFQLVITNTANGQERTLVSSLDPRLYRRWYGVKAVETVMYTDTWMCHGNTSHFQAICPNPKSSGPGAPPAP